MQISMSVMVVKRTTVMRMQTALTQREVSSALAILVTLEMDLHVQVSKLEQLRCDPSALC